MKILEGSVTSPSGFLAAGISCGLKASGKPDLALLVSEDWQRPDASTMRLEDRTNVPLMPGVHYHVAIGTLTESTDSILAAYFGDGVVGGKSALATRDNRGAASIRWRVFTKTSHVALMTNPEIQQFVSDALAVREQLTP